MLKRISTSLWLVAAVFVLAGLNAALADNPAAYLIPLFGIPFAFLAFIIGGLPGSK